MTEFELIDRDGLARIGRLSTPHGVLETPALLPVIHPDPERQPVPPREIARRFGLRGAITSAYITWRTPGLREVALRDGIHALVGCDGPLMTDSGAFQQHAYGSVEVGPEEILDFQGRIGSDIATVLDLFTEPETPHEAAEHALDVTLERATAARGRRAGLLAVPVQGGRHPDLRARSAREASRLGDVLAVGGVVPLMEQYRFRELVEVLAASRPHLDPGRAVHLFGAGHPMGFALSALFGVDLFDSSAYTKFARRGRLLLPEGSVPIEEVDEPICRCELCAERPLSEVADLPPSERERALAAHNLLTSAEEVAEVRRAIRAGRLWELAERRAAVHPALRAGLREALRHPEVFLPCEPEARRAFREIGSDSRERPAVERFRRRLSAYLAVRGSGREVPRVALSPEFLQHLPLEDRSGRPVRWDAPTPLGPIPLELTSQYPVGPWLGLEEYEHPAPSRTPRSVRRDLASRWDEEMDFDADWTSAWTSFEVASLLAWRYGSAAAAAIAPRVRGERSRRTGRLRRLVGDGGPWFIVGLDAVPRPTFVGAGALRSALAPPEGRVVVSNDAAPFVRAGRSLFSRFVRSADPSLVPGSSALLVGESDELLAVGRLVLAPHEMPRFARGVAVRVTAHERSPPPPDEIEPDRTAPDE